MKRHFKKRHIGKTNYQCKVCKKYYTDASSLKEHEGNHDESLRPHKCTKCSKRFATEYKLTEHLLMHQGKTFICSFSQCGRLFTYKKGKQDHEPKCDHNPKKPKDKPFPCKKCSRGYWDHRSLLRHEKEKHLTVRIVRVVRISSIFVRIQISYPFHLSSDLGLNFVCILWRNIHNEKLVQM